MWLGGPNPTGLFPGSLGRRHAMVISPVLTYGPHDYTERLDYWLHCVRTADGILVPMEFPIFILTPMIAENEKLAALNWD